MPQPYEAKFERRPLGTGASIVTCTRCHASVGSAFWEFELDELEARHSCKVEGIRALAAIPDQPNPPEVSNLPLAQRLLPSRVPKRPSVRRRYA